MNKENTEELLDPQLKTNQKRKRESRSRIICIGLLLLLIVCIEVSCRILTAAERHNQALELNEEGELQYNAGNYDEAVSLLNESIKIDSGIQRTYKLLAYSYKKLKDYDKAETALEDGIKTQTDKGALTDLYLQLYYVYYDAGWSDEAKTEMLKDAYAATGDSRFKSLDAIKEYTDT